jgi:hypothetical protein
VHELRVAVLLVQVRSGTRSGHEARAVLDETGMPALAAEVRFLERYRLAFGAVPADLGDYEAVLAELRQEVAA